MRNTAHAKASIQNFSMKEIVLSWFSLYEDASFQQLHFAQVILGKRVDVLSHMSQHDEQNQSCKFTFTI